jgi:hypothetical protein
MKSKQTNLDHKPEFHPTPTMRELIEERERYKPLKVQVTIPSAVVPLFRALTFASKAKSAQAFATRAVCKYLLSEEAMTVFDELVNKLNEG